VTPGTCATCHNGVRATGKTPNHVATTASCDTCHTTAAWLPARFDHAGVTGSCGACHNGTRATGKTATHFQTTRDCVDCHTTARWTPSTFRHASATYPDHGARLTCIQCHTANSQAVAWRNPAYAPDCAGCHAGNYKPGSHKKYETPATVFYTVGELRDCAGACHVYTDSTLTAIKTRRNSHHRATSGGF
jgi:hypothetical protein